MEQKQEKKCIICGKIEYKHEDFANHPFIPEIPQKCCEECSFSDYGCVSINCPCHKKVPSKSYDDYSHTHCWNNKDNPCNIPLEKHTQCCLCDKKVPQEELKRQCNEAYDKECFDILSPSSFTSKKNWEERFDEYFYDSDHSLTENQVKHIKTALFIPAIAQAQAEKVKEIREHCRKMKRIIQAPDDLPNQMYNQALQDILSKL